MLAMIKPNSDTALEPQRLLINNNSNNLKIEAYGSYNTTRQLIFSSDRNDFYGYSLSGPNKLIRSWNTSLNDGFVGQSDNGRFVAIYNNDGMIEVIDNKDQFEYSINLGANPNSSTLNITDRGIISSLISSDELMIVDFDGGNKSTISGVASDYNFGIHDSRKILLMNNENNIVKISLQN